MSQQKRVALFVTCLVDQTMPEVGVATVRLLRRAGYEVDFPQAQTCCGQPFFNSGYRDQARDLARRTIETLEPYSAIVLPSGSCTTMIRVEYPHLLEDEPTWKTRAQIVADKTFELSEFLATETDWKPSPQRPAPSVTYHDSCHMCRMLHLKEQPRELLQAAGCDLAEMSESDRCCGFGGLFSVRMPEVSNAMTTAKLDMANETHSDVMVTADPGCLMQLRGLAERSNVRVEHIATVLDEVTKP